MKRLTIITAIILTASALLAQDAALSQKYAQAQQAMQQFQYEKALELLSFCYHTEPANTDYLLQIGYCNTQLGRYKDAKMFYQQVLGLDSLHIGAISALAGISERENNHRQALDWYSRLIGLDSLNSYYHKKAGIARLRLGDGMSAVFSFREAYQLNDSDLELMDYLSALYLELSADSSAEIILRRGLNIDPGNVRLLHNSARLYSKRRDHAAVTAAVERSRSEGDSSHYYQMVLAVAYLQLDSLDAGIALLEDLDAQEKGTEHVYAYLGTAWRKKGNTERAEFWYNKALTAAISPKTGSYYADMAAIKAEQKDFKNAADLYEKAYSYSNLPKDLFFWAQYNDLYFKDKGAALRLYQRYLNTNDKEYRERVETRVRQIREQQHFNK
jgi:tetratricopeptide (TPR) repeat protein